MEILVATYPLAGHVNPFRPLVREAARRGHRIRWYTGQRFADVVEAAGAEFIGMSPELDRDDRPLDEAYPDRAAKRGTAKLKWDMKELFISPAVGQVADLRTLITDRRPDLIISDGGLTGARLAGELDNVPWATIGITPLALPSRDTAPFGPGLGPSATALSRLRNRALGALLNTVLMRDINAYRNQIRQQVGLPPTPEDLMSSWTSQWLHLQVGVPGLEYPRSDLPAAVHFIGALVGGSSSVDAPDWWPEVESSKRPVVHVTQGTVANADFEDLLLPTLRALAGEDVLVVATLGSAGGRSLQTKLPDNARIASYLPYDRLLPIADVVVTNGGYGGVNDALRHGVPLVIAGRTEDKPEVAARVAWSGAGIDLKSAKPSEFNIRKAVRALLDEPSYGTAAARLAAEYKEQGGAGLAIDLVERAQRQVQEK
ncbi:glycosyltransferase [Kribbella albertanoniae]